MLLSFAGKLLCASLDGALTRHDLTKQEERLLFASSYCWSKASGACLF